jgi:hypothetical protein
MTRYIATFHTHLAALRSSRSLSGRGIAAQMTPVPRKLSSSCGTCVRYEAETPELSLLDRDTEAVYADEGGKYTLIQQF